MAGKLWVSAIHESGHVVCGHFCGINLWPGSSVSILRDENRPESFARTAFDWNGKSPEEIIKVVFSGPIAEGICTNGASVGSTTDSFNIARQLLRIFPNDRHAKAAACCSWVDLDSGEPDKFAIEFVCTVEALAIRSPHPGEVDQDTEENPTFHLLLRLSEETRELVNQNWPLIETFAGLLAERKIIAAQEVESFMENYFECSE